MLTERISITPPVHVGGREIAAFTVREPTSAGFLEHGQPVEERRSGKVPLRARFDRLDIVRFYLAASLGQEMDIDELLDALDLETGIALQRAVLRLVPAVTPENIEYYGNAVVFDWKALTLDEVDAMPLSRLFQLVDRLSRHVKRRNAERKNRGA